ncbi:MAG: hypothetical protein HYW22_03035 [Candidatus Aenigmarchaeota archaeon]|nr:hypothetical protein [Candidatus Aenigmarchaeota archaeon]
MIGFKSLIGVLFAASAVVSACGPVNVESKPTPSPKDQVKTGNVKLSTQVDQNGYRLTIEDWDETVNGVVIHMSSIVDFKPDELKRTSCETSSVKANFYGKFPRLNRADDGYNTLVQIRNVLENVPDAIQKLANDFGITVRIVNDIGDVQKLYRERYSRVGEINLAVDNVAGFYDSRHKIATSPIDSVYNSRANVLHEYGHGIFDATDFSPYVYLYGMLDRSSPEVLKSIGLKVNPDALEWSGIYKKYSTNMNDKNSPLDSYFLKNPDEFFAETFRMYYDNLVTRNRLERTLPEAYTFHMKMYDKMTQSCRVTPIKN